MTCDLCCQLAKANSGPRCDVCDYDHSIGHKDEPKRRKR